MLRRLSRDGASHAELHGGRSERRPEKRSCAAFRGRQRAPFDGCRFFLCDATPADPQRAVKMGGARRTLTGGASEADIASPDTPICPSRRVWRKRQIVNPGSVGQPKHGSSGGLLCALGEWPRVASVLPLSGRGHDREDRLPAGPAGDSQAARGGPAVGMSSPAGAGELRYSERSGVSTAILSAATSNSISG